jgi:hypothetical protein
VAVGNVAPTVSAAPGRRAGSEGRTASEEKETERGRTATEGNRAAPWTAVFGILRCGGLSMVVC